MNTAGLYIGSAGRARSHLILAAKAGKRVEHYVHHRLTILSDSKTAIEQI